MEVSTGSRGRGQSSTVGVVLMVAAVVVVAGTAGAYFTGVTDRIQEPSLAAVSAETRPIDLGAAGDCSGTSTELAVDVTLTNYGQADAIYVVVRDEGGRETKTLWSDPSGDTVGETLTLANEPVGGEVDVDIGGGGDWAYCPGDTATFAFYASTDGKTTSLQELDL